MDGFGLMVIACLSFHVASALKLCPPMCSCSDEIDSHVVINCSNSFSPSSNIDLLKINPYEIFRVETLDNGVEIDLSQNDLTEARFPPSWTGVRKISLRHNKIPSLTSVTIHELESVKELDLSHNDELEKVTNHLESRTLEVLILSECSIKELDDGFLEKLPALKYLDVSRNSLTELSRFMHVAPNVHKESNARLTFLNASHNDIVEMNGRALAGERIRVLDVSSNQIADLKFTAHLAHLRELNASANALVSLDYMVLPKVVVLDLSRNQIRSGRIDLSERAPQIEKLNLARNAIRALTGIESSTLLDLDLSHCSLASIAAGAFSGVPNLQRLDLSGNELRSLDPSTLAGLTRLEFLFLGGNPWKCDCKSETFMALLRFVLLGGLQGSDDLRCHSDEGTTRTWSGTCNNERDQSELELSKSGAFYTLFYIFIVLMLIIIFFACFKWMRYMTQSASMSLDTGGTVVNDAESEVTPPTIAVTSPRLEDPPPALEPPARQRRSTPPPDYEAALLLPQLTEEEREKAISTLSLHRDPE